MPEITGNEAAMKLSTLLQKYKVSVNWKIGQKTGILTNLVEDLLGETYQTEVETLGIKAAVEKLKAETNASTPCCSHEARRSRSLYTMPWLRHASKPTKLKRT
ncbi:MAG: DUF6261 family protein [Prevotellamassilia sp.]